MLENQRFKSSRDVRQPFVERRITPRTAIGRIDRGVLIVDQLTQKVNETESFGKKVESCADFDCNAKIKACEKRLTEIANRLAAQKSHYESVMNKKQKTISDLQKQTKAQLHESDQSKKELDKGDNKNVPISINNSLVSSGSLTSLALPGPLPTPGTRIRAYPRGQARPIPDRGRRP